VDKQFLTFLGGSKIYPASNLGIDQLVIIRRNLNVELLGKLYCFHFLSLLEEKYWKLFIKKKKKKYQQSY
jgi:hypothetical protein